MTPYRSGTGRRALERCYDAAFDHLEVEIEETHVETRYGPTHVLLAGPEDGTPVFVFHGGTTTNPMALSWYADLADEYRLIAPDTVGHPGKSAQTPLDPRGNEYGRWATEVLDAFDVESAPMIGTSYGAGIVLRTASFAPDRIDRAALVVPAGLGTGSVRSSLKIDLLSALSRHLPHERVLDRLVSALVTDTESDQLAVTTIETFLRHIERERELPNVRPEDLEEFTAPVGIFVGNDDPLCSPESVSQAAQECLRSIWFIESYPREKHVLSPSAREKVTTGIRTLFESRRDVVPESSTAAERSSRQSTRSTSHERLKIDAVKRTVDA